MRAPRTPVRWAAAGAALLATAALALPAAAAAPDPVLDDLEHFDVHVSPAELGTRTGAAQVELRIVAAELDETGRPVKLAVVRGRGDTRRLLAYARRLRDALEYRGTVVLTTPGGATAAAGPASPAEVTASLRRARIGLIADPVQRLESAAGVAAVEPREASGTRTTLTLLGIAVLGGAWAVAIGTGRRSRRGRQELAEGRAAMRVHLDTLRARAAALARSGRLPDTARPRVQAALGSYADGITALQHATSADEVAKLGPTVAAGLAAVTAAGRDIGEEWALSGSRFDGLCGADPAHGPPAGDGPLTPGGPPVPLCANCLDAAARGEAVPLRMVSAGGRPMPFTEVEELPAPPAGGPPGQELRASPS
ncbi:MAG TPA: hypothetical protein VFG74_11595 [Miltoncostaeaceae bacterium]|nr:hypothetical protein [Miltoncostaeaceae bacterium]